MGGPGRGAMSGGNHRSAAAQARNENRRLSLMPAMPVNFGTYATDRWRRQFIVERIVRPWNSVVARVRYGSRVSEVAFCEFSGDGVEGASRAGRWSAAGTGTA